MYIYFILAKKNARDQSEIGTFIKKMEAIKANKSLKGITIGRTSINDEKERRFLLLWIKEKEVSGDTLTQTTILYMASANFENLVNTQRDKGDEKTSR